MRLVEFFNAVTLFEAAKDRYWQAFQNLIPVAKELDKEREFEVEVDKELTWAMNTLGKSDKITWYVRYVKLAILIRLLKSEGIDPQIQERVQKTYDKFANQVATKSGISQKEIPLYAQQVTSPDFKRRMDHFMSLGLQPIDDYVFGWQKPQDIWDDWTPIEQAWQAKAGPLVDDEEDIEIIKEYEDGSQWVDLKRPYCNVYGKAMGHCGNAGDPHEPNTSIVYRTPEETEKGMMWKPRLFFVYDKDNGMLGETKGRENQKPAEKYHNVIIDLLRDSRIKGIKGGGYKPENNFKMEDLPPEVSEELVNEKPSLASIAFDYKKRGMTKGLIKRIQATWEDIGEKTPEYKNKSFFHPIGEDADGVAKYYGGDSAEYVAKILSGEGDLDMWSDYDQSDQMWDELPSKVQAQVGKWLIENHEESVEEWKEDNDRDFDGSDASDAWSIIDEYDIDDIKTALNRGVETGNRYGAESSMYESLKDWIEDLPNENEFALSLHPGIEKGWDSQQSIQIPEETMVEITSDYMEDLEYHGDIMAFFQIKPMDSPYNGWEGYDEKAALEDAIEQLHEVGVDSSAREQTGETVGGNEGEINSDSAPLPPPQRGNEEGKPEWEWTDPYHGSGEQNAVMSRTP